MYIRNGHTDFYMTKRKVLTSDWFQLPVTEISIKTSVFKKSTD